MANGNNNNNGGAHSQVDSLILMDELKKILGAPGKWLSTPYGGQRVEVPMERPSYNDPEYWEYMDREREGKENVDYLRRGKHEKELPSFPYIVQTPFSRGNIPDQSWSREDEIFNVLSSLILSGGLGFMGSKLAGAKGNKPINVPDKKLME